MKKRNQYLMRWWRSNVPFAFFLPPFFPFNFYLGILHFFHPFFLSIFTFQFSEKRCRPNVNSRPAQTPAKPAFERPRRNVWTTPFFGKLIYNTENKGSSTGFTLKHALVLFEGTVLQISVGGEEWNNGMGEKWKVKSHYRFSIVP